MSKVILDTNAISKLTSVLQAVEVCDPDGRVVGKFVPAISKSEWEIVGGEPTDEELRQCEQSTARRYSTTEVLTHLEHLK